MAQELLAEVRKGADPSPARLRMPPGKETRLIVDDELVRIFRIWSI